jgi:hypothetical protein
MAESCNCMERIQFLFLYFAWEGGVYILTKNILWRVQFTNKEIIIWLFIPVAGKLFWYHNLNQYLSGSSEEWPACICNFLPLSISDSIQWCDIYIIIRYNPLTRIIYIYIYIYIVAKCLKIKNPNSIPSGKKIWSDFHNLAIEL